MMCRPNLCKEMKGHNQDLFIIPAYIYIFPLVPACIERQFCPRIAMLEIVLAIALN